jgi:hypothetical protein
VAVLALNAQTLNVVAVRKRYRLIRALALLGYPRGPLQLV